MVELGKPIFDFIHHGELLSLEIVRVDGELQHVTNGFLHFLSFGLIFFVFDLRGDDDAIQLILHAQKVVENLLQRESPEDEHALFVELSLLLVNKEFLLVVVLCVSVGDHRDLHVQKDDKKQVDSNEPDHAS